ncbi:MAG: PilZ domain-containing protein [Spirochaetales bacterium]|nr:PilZ domain-containing protein [Spirochaetales bacterium]
MKEQRRYPRALVRLPVIYGDQDKGQSKDISEKGLCLFTRKEFINSNPFDIIVELEKGLLFKAKSQVQWRATISSNLYKTGLEFLNYSTEYEKFLKEFLLKHLSVTKERRQSYRMLLDVVVNYAIQAKAKTKNINSNGLCLFTRDPLEEGKIQQLRINLEQNISIQAFAKVVWNKKLKNNIYENGLSFWDIEDSSLSLLKNHLDGFQ